MARTAPNVPVLLEGGLVFDGLGNPPKTGSILIDDGMIAAVGEVGSSAVPSCVSRVSAKGLAISPGFVNIHSHSDTDMLVHPESVTLVRQGITTEVVGNCGGGPVDGSKIQEDVWQRLSPP